jgi:hypothetical protein
MKAMRMPVFIILTNQLVRMEADSGLQGQDQVEENNLRDVPAPRSTEAPNIPPYAANDKEVVDVAKAAYPKAAYPKTADTKPTYPKNSVKKGAYPMASVENATYPNKKAAYPKHAYSSVKGGKHFGKKGGKDSALEKKTSDGEKEVEKEAGEKPKEDRNDVDADTEKAMKEQDKQARKDVDEKIDAADADAASPAIEVKSASASVNVGRMLLGTFIVLFTL